MGEGRGVCKRGRGGVCASGLVTGVVAVVGSVLPTGGPRAGGLGSKVEPGICGKPVNRVGGGCLILEGFGVLGTSTSRADRGSVPSIRGPGSAVESSHPPREGSSSRPGPDPPAGGAFGGGTGTRGRSRGRRRSGDSTVPRYLGRDSPRVTRRHTGRSSPSKCRRHLERSPLRWFPTASRDMGV